MYLHEEVDWVLPVVNQEELDFDATGGIDLLELSGWLGRAADALEMGAVVRVPGYNLDEEVSRMMGIGEPVRSVLQVALDEVMASVDVVDDVLDCVTISDESECGSSSAYSFTSSEAIECVGHYGILSDVDSESISDDESFGPVSLFEDGYCYLLLFQHKYHSDLVARLKEYPSLAQILAEYPLMVSSAVRSGIGVYANEAMLHFVWDPGHEHFRADDLLLVAGRVVMKYGAANFHEKVLMQAVVGASVSSDASSSNSTVAARDLAMDAVAERDDRAVGSDVSVDRGLSASGAGLPPCALSDFVVNCVDEQSSCYHRTFKKLLGYDVFEGYMRPRDGIGTVVFRNLARQVLGPEVIGMYQPLGGGVHLFVPDADADLGTTAIAGGTVSVMELSAALKHLAALYGDRQVVCAYDEVKFWCPTCLHYVVRDGHNDRCRMAVKYSRRWTERAWLGDVLHRQDVRKAVLDVRVPPEKHTIVETLYVKGSAQADYLRENIPRYADLRVGGDKALSTCFEAEYEDSSALRDAYLKYLYSDLNLRKAHGRWPD